MKQFIFIISALFAAVSCIRDIAPDSALEVRTAAAEYKAGEPVTFLLDGNPDNIVFYSGEKGHEYVHKNSYDRTGTLLLEFSSFVRYGKPEVARHIELKVSKDFNGIYDMENIDDATWTDLSEMFRFSSGADNTISGEADINMFLIEKTGEISAGDSLYFAFHYTDFTDDERTRQDNWIIRSSVMTLVSPSGNRIRLADMRTFGWKSVSDNPEAAWTISPSAAPTQILIDGKTAEKSNAWAVSKAFSIGGIDADSGIVLKSTGSAELDEYTHVYSVPGTYRAVFESSSWWYTGGSFTVKEVEIKITDKE